MCSRHKIRVSHGQHLVELSKVDDAGARVGPPSAGCKPVLKDHVTQLVAVEGLQWEKDARATPDRGQTATALPADARRALV